MTKVVRQIEVQYLSLRCTGVEVNGCTKWKYKYKQLSYVLKCNT